MSLRDIALVARFSLEEGLRSRRSLVLLALYLVGSVAGTSILVEIIDQVEEQAADALAVSSAGKPGAMASRLLQAEALAEVLGGLLGDRALAASLLDVPPVALFYGWLALLFVPLLVALTAADAIAGELGSGAARFVLFRTDRASWVLGRAAGHALLLAAGLGLGAAGAFVTGAVALADFDAPGTAWWLVRLTGRAWAYGLCWLGVVIGLSQLVRSGWKAGGLALGALTLAGIARAILAHPKVLAAAPVAVESARLLLPGSHRLALWQPDPVPRWTAIVVLGAIGATALAAGHAALARRDA
jgi:ABC-type transport system involved in multi-copper enzyme maturation permease subunit